MKKSYLLLAFKFLFIVSILAQTPPNVKLKKFVREAPETIQGFHYVDGKEIIVSRTFTNNGIGSEVKIDIDQESLNKLIKSNPIAGVSSKLKFNKYQFLSNLILNKEDLPYKDEISRFYGNWNKSYLEQIRRKPGRARIYLQRALQVLESNDLKIKNSILANFYCDIVDISYVFKDDNSVINFYVKAIENMPSRGYYYVNIGSKLVSLKEYDLALPYLKAAKIIYPGDHPFTHVSLAMISYGRQEYEKALEYINIAFKREDHLYSHGARKGTRDLSIRSLRGGIKLRLKDLKGAKKDLKEAIKINPQSSSAHRFLGEVYGKLGDNKKACKFLTKARDLKYIEKNYFEDDILSLIEYYCNNKPKPEEREIEPKIYPSPVNTYLYINNLDIEGVTFQIFDYSSTLVKESSFDKPEINVSELKTGLYILKIYTKGKTYTRRFVKE